MLNPPQYAVVLSWATPSNPYATEPTHVTLWPTRRQAEDYAADLALTPYMHTTAHVIRVCTPTHSTIDPVS